MTELVWAVKGEHAGPAGGRRARGLGPRLLTTGLLSWTMATVDAILMVAASAASYAVWLAGARHAPLDAYAFATLFGTLLALNAFHLSGLYRFQAVLDLRASLKRLAGAWTIVAALLIVSTFFGKVSDDFSRGWAGLWFVGGLLLLLLARVAMQAVARRCTKAGLLMNRAVIVGTPAMAARLRRYFAEHPESGVAVLGEFDERLEALAEVADATTPAAVADLERCVRENRIDTVILALPMSDETGMARLFHRLRTLPVDVRLFPGRVAFGMANKGVTQFGQLPMLNVLDRPLAGWRVAAKEVEDRVLGTLILLLIAPVLLGIAVAVKLDSPGPVLFRQRRLGFNNQLIEVLKFRTMYHDQCDGNAVRLTSRDDPRVTRLGAVLRRTSLDELPQFINVLKGEMSVVGPRPHALSAKADGVLYHNAVANYAARHRVKPGITGWAQVNGWRGETITREQILKRVEHDIHYIEHWSVWLDLRIIVLTVLKGFAGRNAY